MPPKCAYCPTTMLPQLWLGPGKWVGPPLVALATSSDRGPGRAAHLRLHPNAWHGRQVILGDCAPGGPGSQNHVRRTLRANSDMLTSNPAHLYTIPPICTTPDLNPFPTPTMGLTLCVEPAPMDNFRRFRGFRQSFAAIENPNIAP